MDLKQQQSQHPNVHRAAAEWSEERKLHLAMVYSNPNRSQVRRELFNDTAKRMEKSPNVVLYKGEIALGEREFEVTCKDNPRDLQIRTWDELWHKETMINLVVNRMPEEADVIGYADGDIQMSRYDWALEAINQLMHFRAVQLFSQFTDMDRLHRPYSVCNGFAYSYMNSITHEVYSEPVVLNGPTGKMLRGVPESLIAPECYYGAGPEPKQGRWPGLWWGATGLGWAFWRETWDLMGGLFDECIMGSADWIMAYGMAGLVDDMDVKNCAPYYAEIKHWQQHAKSLQADIGYIDNHIQHYWHGPKAHRFYRERERILMENDFNPRADLKRDRYGLWQLAGNKPKLRDDLRMYFRARWEDNPTPSPDMKLLA